MQILKKYVLPTAFVAFLVFIDQITKWLAVQHIAPLVDFLPPRDIVVIENFLRLTYLENSGMAFGMLQGGRWIFIVLTVILIPIVIYFYITAPKNRLGKLYGVALLVLLAGALGNFIDRVLNSGGYVIDFIRFEFFPFVFNAADVYVVVSVIALLIMTIFMKEEAKINDKKS